ncbi:MAG: acyl-CoA dehydrogenase family protein, partial [Gemmatimonadota bacterium]
MRSDADSGAADAADVAADAAGAFAVDTATVRAFLDDSHVEFASRAAEFARRELAAEPGPPDDAGARVRAREILAALGVGRWLDPIAAGDFRACCLLREALAAASPLADAVFALQALGAVPIRLAGGEALAKAWLEPAIAGRAMGAFAMTEPEAGSDVAAIATRAVRDGDAYVIDGRKTLISNAGIADFYVVFASTDPEAGREGLSAFVIPGEASGLRFLGPQVMSAPHPLGEIAFEGCRVPAAYRLGEEGDGFRIGMATL